jgi:hypothetical protein
MEKNIFIRKEKILELLTALLFILIGISLRFLPHPPNFSPITAIALFGGVYLSRKIAFIIPIAVLIISDIFIGYYGFSLMASVYGSFLLVVGLGFWLKKHKKWHNIIGCTIFSSLLFFIITNFAVWAFTPWYTKTISGFIQCYLLALPFFKNTLLGDLVFVPIFFGAYEAAFVLVRNKIHKIQHSLAR